MLKRLELVGFKSFADKTTFDFCAGITGIVGPNGSGKSNIVDGVRWVLGEQSAKSLRGGEMADVIFNGSASRRSLGLAEVTMVFDNSRRALATEAEEVQITRRVYRSGEGEYLINQHVCRLKDIKDLFLGSGAGADAYCIIEQGRVDVLLQASTKERRTIFEEAAGISRFKAKKTETLRKLERVEQNLLRLRDILDEVEKQLRSVKLQAAKAQRYQEYSERLKELRVGVSLQEYHQISERLSAEASVLDGLRATLQEQMIQANAWERELRDQESRLAGLDGSIRGQESELAAARQQIAAEEATLSHEWTLAASLEKDLTQTRQQLAEQTRHVAMLREAAATSAGDVQHVEQQCVSQRQSVQGLVDFLQATESRLAELQQQMTREKDEHLECMRQSARLQNDAVSYKAQVENLARERERLRQRSELAAEHLASLDIKLQELTAGEEALQSRLAAARQQLSQSRQERDRLRQLSEETGERAAQLRTERSGLASRIEVLEGLERSHEGLGTGPREVLALLEQPNPGPWRTVLGIVADFFTVRREYAPLIDLALGERAQRFLVRDVEELAAALKQNTQAFAGRVSFLPLEGPAILNGVAPGTRLRHAATTTALRTTMAVETAPAHSGVVALAENVVRCENPQLSDLPSRLLGRTLIVRDLSAARTLAEQYPRFRFVTLQGELLEADGTLTTGTHHAEMGILSRKSELRELREQVVGLDSRIAELERDLADLRERVGGLDGQVETQQMEIDVLSQQVAELRSRIGQHRQRRDGLHEEVQVSQSEITNLEQEIGSLETAWSKARADAAEAEARVQVLLDRVAAAEREIHDREEKRQQQQDEALAAKVALAQSEERLKAARARQQQLDTDLGQRQQEREQRQRHLLQTRSRLEDNQRTLLAASSAQATWYVRKEESERRLGGLSAERHQLRLDRQQRAEQAQSSQASWRNQQELAHARELEVNNLRHQLETLCARLQEDYHIDLAALYQEKRPQLEATKSTPARCASEGETNVDQAAAAAAVNDEPGPASRATLSPAEEIAELRRKLSRLGSVNLEAIQELTDLEARASTLQIQFDDLTAAQKSLQDIINKINGDSRRLFTETFHTIRTHFQELFRKLFGGGMADIVLEEETDILETGIEIIARPPGKELRSISLMSGGEKTMTAVALLLAIFRSKPSPFCILDEVDAALDEANIGRFTGVLREFLDRSHFIIVTHSKRTMACADVLYGITMQESGISRRFAVKFEDWPDDEKAQGA
jgi:chromosome segregation protein